MSEEEPTKRGGLMLFNNLFQDSPGGKGVCTSTVTVALALTVVT